MLLKNQINMMGLIMNLYNRDLDVIKSSEQIKIDESTFYEFKLAASSNDLNAVLLIIDRLLKEAAVVEDADQIIMLSYFMYRYIYFFKTLVDWEKYLEIQEDVPVSDIGEMFLTSIAPFFDNQISFFIGNFEKYLEELNIKDISLKLYEDIIQLIENIKNTSEFDIKLNYVEELTKYFQDSRNLTSLLEGITNESKEMFLTVANEIKVDFQSMNNLISAILQKLKGLKVN